jgi:hypothetical protein
MENKRLGGMVLSVVGMLGAIGVVLQYSDTGCIRPNPKVPEVCGSGTQILTIVLFLMFVGLPLGFVFDSYLKKPKVGESEDKLKK